MRADGTETRRLTTGAEDDSRPAWSTDGRQIVFARGGELWIVPFFSGNAHRLTNGVGGDAADPAWSPDGKVIAYDYRKPGFSIREVWGRARRRQRSAAGDKRWRGQRVADLVARREANRLPEQHPRKALRDLLDRPRRHRPSPRDQLVDRHDRPGLVAERNDRLLARRRDLDGRPPRANGEADIRWERREPGMAAEGLAPPLDGLRVVDLSRVLAGPYCTMMLADLGADVVKIERPGEGDETRAWGPPYAGGEAAYFLAVNRSKRSVAVDLKHPEGCALVLDLCARADVVLENFRPGCSGTARSRRGRRSRAQPRGRLLLDHRVRQARIARSLRVRLRRPGGERADGDHRRAGRPTNEGRLWHSST